jgi:hypothetical protein
MVLRDGVTKRGSTWSYVVRVRDPETGTSKPRWVGGFATEAAAKAARDEARVKARAGGYIDRGRITVSDYLDSVHAWQVLSAVMAAVLATVAAGAALILDRLLFRPDISQVAADRVSVMRYCRSLPLAVGRCCQLGAGRLVARRWALEAYRSAQGPGSPASCPRERFSCCEASIWAAATTNAVRQRGANRRSAGPPGANVATVIMASAMTTHLRAVAAWLIGAWACARVGLPGGWSAICPAGMSAVTAASSA